mgnify:CR=1 FL=1|tara:strand:+ start:9253 stop:10083 length:831 start_codon:yes stop_codon:yes gene_type:complete
MWRNIIGVGTVILFGVFVISWVLGDNSGPWLNSARQTASKPLIDLIGEYRLKYEQAKATVDEAAKRAEVLNENVMAERIAMRTLERNIATAKDEIERAKTDLAGFEKRLAAGQPIVLVSGRRLDDAGVRSRVADLSNKIAIATEKMSFLTSIRDSRQARLAKLEDLRLQAPTDLHRLQASLSFLEAKLAMYEEMKELVEDNETDARMATGMFGKAQDALEEAHQSVDQKLAKFEAIVDASLDSSELAPMENVTETTGDDLLADIRSILSDNSSQQP